MSREIDLNGRVALVTGASRGIGRAAARKLAGAGAKVAIGFHSSRDRAESLAAQFGENAITIQADMANPDQVRRMIVRTVEKLGRLDILVNNAGIFERLPFDEPDYDKWQASWQRVFDVNVFGAANASHQAMVHMREQRYGKIVNIASRAASRGETLYAPYGASKAALVTLTRSIARACAPHGITANVINPGFIQTDMAEEEIQTRGDEIVSEIPLGRVGTPEDVAETVLFLSSPMSDYLNGATIDVNGGSWFS